jgi:hypothetical protein
VQQEGLEVRANLSNFLLLAVSILALLEKDSQTQDLPLLFRFFLRKGLQGRV